MRKGIVLAVFSAIIALGLLACGGGSSSSNPPSKKISGTAAAGASIVGSVTIKDSSFPAKTKTVSIAADGNYSVDISGMSAPFVFRADGTVGGKTYHLCSVATEADVNNTINITPFTDLIVANIAGTLAENYFNSGDYSTLTAEQMNIQEAALQAALLPTLQALGLDNSIDLLRSSFSADHTGLDAALDIIKVSVDSSTNVATLTNVVTQQTITNDISTGSTSGTLDDTTGVATGLTAIQAIALQFSTWSQLFTASLPGPDNTQLLGLFDQSTFIQDGQDLPSFLSDVTSDPSNLGISFINVVIQSINDTQDAAVVSFSVMKNGVLLDTVANWNCIKKNGAWLIQGDQRIAGVSVESSSIYGVKNAALIATGVSFRIADAGGIGITTAEISGPGIVSSITATNNIGMYFFQVPNSFDGILYGMTDGQIAQIPTTGAVYTFKLYAGSSLLATYTETLSHKPYVSTQLTAANYISITAPTSAALSTFTSGNLHVSWILPSGLAADWITLGMTDNSVFNFFEMGVKPTDTSATLIVTAIPSFTPTRRWLWVNGRDSNDVVFAAFLDY